ncbi:MAG: ABC transporter ATP-binding protein [Candidatus Competibacterales bacterium]
MALLQVRDLCKGYGAGVSRHGVFAHLSFDLQRGECAALVGESGAGKSTLLNLIAGIDRPDGGEVNYAGQNIAALGEGARTRWRRRHLGFVFQFFNLIPTLTVAENVLLPLELNGRGGNGASARVATLLDQVGLAAKEKRFPEVLSGGEQQRVAIARALAHEPDLLLADEPTGNLDPATGDQVLDALFALSNTWGTTVLLVTHSRAVARRAGRILRLADGLIQSVPRESL